MSTFSENDTYVVFSSFSYSETQKTVFDAYSKARDFYLQTITDFCSAEKLGNRHFAVLCSVNTGERRYVPQSFCVESSEYFNTKWINSLFKF